MVFKKYQAYEAKVIAKRKARKGLIKDVRKSKLEEAKAKKLKLKKKLTPKRKKMIRKVRAKRYSSALKPANVYGIKI